jgi:hypothetical protein
MWPVTLPSVHAPTETSTGHRPPTTTPWVGASRPAQGRHRFRAGPPSLPDRIRSINAVGLQNDSPQPNRSCCRSLGVVVGAQHLPVPRWESRAHQQSARTFGLRDTPDGPGQSCSPRWPCRRHVKTGSGPLSVIELARSRKVGQIQNARAVDRPQAGAATPGRSSPASGFAACALEDPAAAQRRHRPDEP